jgi:hypothetical protein
MFKKNAATLISRLVRLHFLRKNKFIHGCKIFTFTQPLFITINYTKETNTNKKDEKETNYEN